MTRYVKAYESMTTNPAISSGMEQVAQVAQSATAFPRWPRYDDDEVEAVRAVLQSGKVNYWTGGEGRVFEQEYAASVGVKHAIAVANGTVALDLALHALAIGQGDEVIVTSRSFVASASCVALCGAMPVFAEIDRESQNITAATIEPLVTSRTRAIIVVHLAGWPCEMDEIMSLARPLGIAVIEDCAQAHGAKYKGKPVGSLADIAVFSFCQDKIITTGGEGGLVATDNDVWWRRAWEFKDHGKSHDKVFGTDHPPGFRWVHDDFGGNGRLTEMQAAIGRIQLRKLPDWHAARVANAVRLREWLADVPGLRVPLPPLHVEHAYYRLYAFFDSQRFAPGWDQSRLMAAIEAEGVPVSVGSCGEIYREKSFASRHIGPLAPWPIAQECGETSLAFALHPGLEPQHFEAIGRAVGRAMERASRSDE